MSDTPWSFGTQMTSLLGLQLVKHTVHTWAYGAVRKVHIHLVHSGGLAPIVSSCCPFQWSVSVLWVGISNVTLGV